MEYHGKSWDAMEYREMSSGGCPDLQFLGYGISWISRDIMECHGISWDIIGCHGISLNFI